MKIYVFVNFFISQGAYHVQSRPVLINSPTPQFHSVWSNQETYMQHPAVMSPVTQYVQVRLSCWERFTLFSMLWLNEFVSADAYIKWLSVWLDISVACITWLELGNLWYLLLISPLNKWTIVALESTVTWKYGIFVECHLFCSGVLWMLRMHFGSGLHNSRAFQMW